MVKHTCTLKISDNTSVMIDLTEPYCNVGYLAYKVQGKTDSAKMNSFNETLFVMSAPFGQSILKSDFLTSNTDLTFSDYGDAPFGLAKDLGIDKKEMDKIHNIVVLRACLLTPYFVNPNVMKTYWKDFMTNMNSKIETLFKQQEFDELEQKYGKK